MQIRVYLTWRNNVKAQLRLIFFFLGDLRNLHMNTYTYADQRVRQMRTQRRKKKQQKTATLVEGKDDVKMAHTKKIEEKLKTYRLQGVFTRLQFWLQNIKSYCLLHRLQTVAFLVESFFTKKITENSFLEKCVKN